MYGDSLKSRLMLPEKIIQAYTFFDCAFLFCVCFSDIVFFYKSKVCGNPALSKSVGTIFPTAFAHFIFLGHTLVILTVFQTFSFLLCLSWWIRDLWSYYYHCLGHYELRPYKMTNLINTVCVLTAPLMAILPSLFPSSSLPVPWNTTILKVGQLITIWWPLSVQVKGRVPCLSL